MRINGFTQIKGFYSWVFENQDKNIRSTHISLYMFLVNQNNRNSWVEWFKCPFDLAMGGSGVSNKKTYYTTLKDLQEWKLIQYQKGINNYKAPLIKLEVLFDTSTVPQSEPQVQPQSIPLPLPLLKPQLYKNIKLITNNLELITLNIEKVLIFLKSDLPSKVEKLNYDEIKKIFNSLCVGLPSIQLITEKRKKLILARQKDFDLETIGNVFKLASESDFLNGGSDNGFKASFDWLLKSENFIKVLEGNYNNKSKVNKQKSNLELLKKNSTGWGDKI